MGEKKRLERELLLLGLLHDTPQHGYQLFERVQAEAGFGLQFSKSTLYDLLKKMAALHWIKSKEKKVGKRPVRRTYYLTAKGKRILQQELRTQLAAYTPPQFPQLPPLALLHHLPAEEALLFLQERHAQIEAIIAALPEQSGLKPGATAVHFMHRYYNLELTWLNLLLAELAANCL